MRASRSARRFRWRRQEGRSPLPQRAQPVPRLHRPLPRQDSRRRPLVGGRQVAHFTLLPPLAPFLLVFRRLLTSSPVMLSCLVFSSSLLVHCCNNFCVLWLLVASEGSLKSPGSRKVDSKCPNAGNPFHECGEHCATKMQQAEQHKGVNIKSPRRKGRSLRTDGLNLLLCNSCITSS